jgi:predicted enzyme related to lactoylglutathione lyase
MNLNQITIPSLDIEKAVNFYEILGLKLIVDALPRYVRFECPDGEATFSIHKAETLPKGNGLSIYFEDENLDALVSQLKQKGITFISDPEDKTWLWREAHLEDPDGNHIILYHAGTNRKNPPWRIK